MTDRTPLILDVDTGIDDSLALLYAAASPDADLVAATCVSGNVDARQVGINTRAILELAGRTDVEVALGREVPLVRPLETTPETHGPQGLGSRRAAAADRAALGPPRRRRHPRRGAPAAGRDHARHARAADQPRHRRPARAGAARPARGLRADGRRLRVSGNTTPTTEWNIHCDPEAAKIVFRAWADAREADPSIPRPLALGLDVTEQARILPDDVVRLARRAGSTPDDSIALARGEDPMHATRSVAEQPGRALRRRRAALLHGVPRPYDGFYGAFIHDPLAVAAALDRSLVTTEALYVDVETRGELTTGMTVADRRRLTGKPPNLDVAVTADVPSSSTASSSASADWRRTTRTCHARRRRRRPAPATRQEDGMNLDWLQICAEGQTTPASRPIQPAYLVALLVGAVLLAIIARRSRDLTTATLTLMPVAIAINIAVGSIAVALRLPIYLDSIGTVLVGALAGPWAGALTGILSNLIWSILPVPGGAGPTAAFFAPVAGVIGLMAGFWASRGVFQLRPDDVRVGGFLALAAGIVGGRGRVARRPGDDRHPGPGGRRIRTSCSQTRRFVLIALGYRRRRRRRRLAHRPDRLRLRGDDPRIRPYLSARPPIAAFALVFALLRLLFGPTGYFSRSTAYRRRPAGRLPRRREPDRPGHARPARPDRRARHRRGRRFLLAGLGAARRERPAVPGLGRRPDDGPRRGRDLGADRRRRVRWRDGRRHRRPRRAVPDARAERLPVGLRAGPDQRPARQDHQLHDRVPHPRRPADHGPDDVQPRRDDGRRMTVRGGLTHAGMSATTGYFVAGASWLHRRNPLTKLLALGAGPAGGVPAAADRAADPASRHRRRGVVRRPARPLVRAMRIPAVLLLSILVVNASSSRAPRTARHARPVVRSRARA